LYLVLLVVPLEILHRALVPFGRMSQSELAQQRQVAPGPAAHLEDALDLLGDEALVERKLLRVIEADVILDRVRNAAEQIGVRHHFREVLGQHGNREREGSRNSRKNSCLVGEIVEGGAR